MIILFVTAIVLGLFVLSLLRGLTEAAYNVKFSRDTHIMTWLAPAILAAIFWVLTHL